MDAAGAARFLVAGGLCLDCWRFQAASAGDGWVVLSPMEFALLRHLVERAGRVLSWRELYRDVWGSADDVGGYVVRQCVAAIRSRVGERVIVTVRRHGYMVEGGLDVAGGGSSELRELLESVSSLAVLVADLSDRVDHLERSRDVHHKGILRCEERLRALEKPALTERPKRRRVAASKRKAGK